MKKYISILFLLISTISYSQRSVPVTLIADTLITLDRPYPANSLFFVIEKSSLYANPASTAVGVKFYELEKVALTSSSNFDTFAETDPLWNAEKSNYVTSSFLTSQNYLQSFSETDPLWNAEKSNYVTSSFLTSQNYLQSFSEADPLWNAEKSNYVTSSFLTSQNYLQSFSETDPLWNAEKSNYATLDFVKETIKTDTIIFRPDSLNTIYTFSLAANDSLIFDSVEIHKTFIFNLSVEGNNGTESELISNTDYTFKNSATGLKSTLWCVRPCTTKATVKTETKGNKLYFMAKTDSNALNFNIHMFKKILL